MSSIIDYHPAPTIRDFIRHYTPGELFADWIMGPVGSGKTTGIFFKLIYMASLQAVSPITKKRHVRAVIVRNTMPQLKDTTITSWSYWFKDGEAGKWNATDKNFSLRFGDVECEVLFRALDTADDIARVLSLETTFVVLDEFVQIPQAIVDALAARCGRYPPEKDGGATNFGMWGASNPGNEDDWWHEALLAAEQFGASEQDRVMRRNERILDGKAPESNWTFFQQPSGFSPEAENLDKLPGKGTYYTALAKDKAEHWVKQFIEVEWGYSISGKPVIATFNADIHVARAPLRFNPHLKLVGGLDPGMNCAMIFGQVDNFGRMNVLSELVTRDYGAKRFISDKLKPHLKQKFMDADFVVSPDPASNQRAQTDERTVADIFRKEFKVKVATQNNRLPGRIDAIEHYTTRITENGAALQIDPSCKTIIRALRSGWRYTTTLKGDTKEEPMKNVYSHPADAFSYLCQYFFVDSERTAKRKNETPLPQARNSYNVR
jgi:hypothetical protein